MNHGNSEWPWNKGTRFLGLIVAGLVMATILGLCFGYFVQLLWNWLMPELFHLSKITYWQGFGLVILSHLIFGCIGHGGHHHGNHHHRCEQERYAHLRHHWEESHWRIQGDWRNWRYYDEWWTNEGKAAFEKYIDEREHKTQTTE